MTHAKAIPPGTGSPDAFKARMRAQWDDAAVGWDRHGPAIDAWLEPATETMMAMAAVNSGDRVLDVAAGSGAQSLVLARRVGPTGHVVASDISPVILVLAKRNAAGAGWTNIETHLADAEDLGLPDGVFDAAVCRLGLMFLPDPAAALLGIRRVLKSGGRFCAAVFAGPDQNPCIRILMSTALRHAGLPTRDPFRPGGLLSLGRPGALDALFRQAGFGSVATVRMEAPFRMPMTDDYIAFARDAAGPVQAVLAPLDPAARDAAWADMTDALSAYQTADGWVGPNSLYLTAGQA